MKYFLAAAFSLLIAQGSLAATYTSNGYTWDDATNYVAGGGLEWMRWSETAGQSIQDAESIYVPAGWRVATVSEMAGLFSAFDFGPVFGDNENLNYYSESYGAAVPPVFAEFQQLFGLTSSSGGNYAYAWFGNDADGDGKYGYAGVVSEQQAPSHFWHWGGYVGDEYGNYGKDYSSGSTGVALVRDVSAVPLPAAAYLFLTAIAGLPVVRRLKRQ